MSEEEPRTPLSEAQEETFEEAVEEAAPQHSESDEKKDISSSATQDATDVTGNTESDVSNVETSKTEAAAEGTAEQTKPSHSVTSSLQATPTNIYFPNDDENTQKGELESTSSEYNEAQTHEARNSADISNNIETNAQTDLEGSSEAIATDPPANGHAKTPSLQAVPPTPSTESDSTDALPHSRQASTELSVIAKTHSPKESSTGDHSSNAAISDEMLDEEQEPPVKRLIRSPFSFFSRTGSTTERMNSPSQGRRGTMSSVTTVDSVSTSKQDDSDRAKTPHRNSLKDRFKLLRMQEEAGIKWVGDADGERPGSSSSGVDMSAMLPPREEEEDEQDGEAVKTPITPRARTTSAADVLGSVGQPTVNEELAPGTAVGTSAGPPPERAQEVDWDLWQAVVYEGPAAVARTSPDELNQAIAGGIPSAIRGVVWQVLAQSSNSELESIYKELVKRGEDYRPKPTPVSTGLSRTTSMLRSRPSILRKGSSPRGRSLSSKRESSTTRDKLGNGVPKEQKPVAEKDTDTASLMSLHSAVSSPLDEPEKFLDGTAPKPNTGQHNGVNSGQTQAQAQDKPEDEMEKQKIDEGEKIQRLERAIRRDLGARTSYSKFLMSAGLQNGLFGICKAYALYDEEVGYAQGMNFIAMPLLFNMPEEEAFCLFDRLMKHYHLRDMFIHDMPGLHLHLYQFERLLEDFEPAVYCHLHRRGVTPQLYATQWFLTLFAYRFPLQLVLRIYDLILSEGLESAILKFGIVLMQKNAEKLLEMKDMAVLTTFLKERLFDVYIDKAPSTSSVLESGFFGSAGGIDKEVYKADALVQDACNIEISSEMLKQYTGEWDERTRIEKAKLAEDDALRSSHQSLSLQIKTLEERSQKYDSEHVQIAQTLVHTQLENQKLADDNESLRTQITELRQIVSAQPGEVEERLKSETERIIQRNAEVQNANRHLEESMTEMENELVQTKLKAAQMEEQLEDLKAKWVNISQVMNATGGMKGSPRMA